MNMFTQCVAVLLDIVPAAEEIERALEPWNVLDAQDPAPGESGWLSCGPGWIVELRTRGTAVLVDLAVHPWPDDPAATADADAASKAWSMGMFGPSAAPGALARACEQSWAWAEGAALAKRHRAFLRLRTVVQLPDGAPQLPKTHDPLHELATLTEMAANLLRMEGASAFFAPGGEALRSRAMLEEALSRKTGMGPPPLELWTNLRAIGLGQDAGARWVLADVVGMRQLRLPDQEAIYAEGQEQADGVAALLTNACLHLASGKGIADGSTSDDGRGRRWKASAATGVLAPARRDVLRWLPEQSARPSEALLAKLRGPQPAPAGG